MPADHRFPEDARAHPLGSVSQHIDKDVSHRYAEVSGDWAEHHFDIEVARAAGFDFVFTHGLCTMAICTHRLLGLLGVDDPGRVARVAVRFASPTPLDEELTVNAYGIDQNSFAFEATSRGAQPSPTEDWNCGHDQARDRRLPAADGLHLCRRPAPRARCEDLGIDSLWLYDHLYGPGMPDYPSLEAWTLATALLSSTERIQVGHMVLCNQFRHPAVLAKMATTAG